MISGVAKGSKLGSFARTFASLTFASSRVLFGWSVIYGSVGEELFSLSPFSPRGSWLFRMVFSSDNSWLLSLLCRVMKYSTSVFISDAFWEHFCLASTSDCLGLWVYSLWKKNGKEKTRGSMRQQEYSSKGSWSYLGERNSERLMQRLKQSTPFLLVVWGLMRTSEIMSIFFWSLSPSISPICVSLAHLLSFKNFQWFYYWPLLWLALSSREPRCSTFRSPSKQSLLPLEFYCFSILTGTLSDSKSSRFEPDIWGFKS